MTTVTTTEIKARLEATYTDVKDLVEIKPETTTKPGARNAGFVTLNGLTLFVGVYPLGKDLENCEYQRFVHVLQTRQTFTF